MVEDDYDHAVIVKGIRGTALVEWLCDNLGLCNNWHILLQFSKESIPEYKIFFKIEDDMVLFKLCFGEFI